MISISEDVRIVCQDHVTYGAETAYPSVSDKFTPVSSGVRVARSLVVCVLLYRSSFVLLHLFLLGIVFSVLPWFADYCYTLLSSNFSLRPYSSQINRTRAYIVFRVLEVVVFQQHFLLYR